MTTLVRTSSSWRVRSLDETLAIARRIAPIVGITRVTDTTALDAYGVPVFASIRPTAARGSLCVNAGKGMTCDEAEAGAYMEAIELAFAEPGRSPVPRRTVAARDFGDVDFSPSRPLAPDLPVLAVEATDITDGSTLWAPAERVFFPLLPGDGGGLFGSEGNGICSGNSLEEATLHGLAEVIERDVASFVLSLREGTRRIRNETLPPHLAALAERVAAVGGELHVRWVPNAYGVPYFLTGLLDTHHAERGHRGDGLHPSASVAATRAVCEAFQSRLTDIHGGRDDLAFHRARENPADHGLAAYRRFVDLVSGGEAVDFDTVPDLAEEAADIERATRLLVERARAVGLTRVLRVVLSPPELEVTVLRVLVPGSECRVGLISRVGRRLARALEAR